MGDMAREALLRGEAEMELLEGYLNGDLSDEDAYDHGLINESGGLCAEGAVHAASRPLHTSQDLDEEISKYLHYL